MSLQIYNTETRKKQLFKPINENKIGIYVCGITVYDYCHIGHARVMVVFDTIVRHLRSLDYDVTYVRNITDIDDKIINRSIKNNEDIKSLTKRFIKAMHQDEQALNVLRPDQEPLATEHIPQIEAMITKLIAKNHAYIANNGDVYFKVKSAKNYGRLSGKNIDDLEAGARVEINLAKHDPLDFVLWKASKDNTQTNEPSWHTSMGNGRPGWHIECSAMATKCLGNHFDIHGGGMDLTFPHHENEIVQAECATGEHYVNTWMHCGFVRIDDEKMSKSLDNFFTIKEVLKHYHAEVIRYFLLASHYRSSVNYSNDNLDIAKASLSKLYSALELVKPAPNALKDSSYEKRFTKAMNDDFNTPQALAVLFELAKEVNKTGSAKVASLLKKLANQLGLLEQDATSFFKNQPSKSSLTDEDISKLIAERTQARANKNFARSDEIRDLLLKQNIELLDGTGGTNWRRN